MNDVRTEDNALSNVPGDALDCPFDGPGPYPCGIDEPCPVCGDLGTLTIGQPSNCVITRALQRATANTGERPSQTQSTGADTSHDLNPGAPAEGK